MAFISEKKTLKKRIFLYIFAHYAQKYQNENNLKSLYFRKSNACKIVSCFLIRIHMFGHSPANEELKPRLDFAWRKKKSGNCWLLALKHSLCIVTRSLLRNNPIKLSFPRYKRFFSLLGRFELPLKLSKGNAEMKQFVIIEKRTLLPNNSSSTKPCFNHVY